MGQFAVFAVGDKLGAYTIRRRIGVGGMGEVYLAEHLHIGRKAAIKVLLPELSSRPDIVARFFNEARATGLLRHPGIVEILDCDVHASGRAYIVMEFLEGETLGRCLERVGNFQDESPTAAAIAGQMAAALAAAHAKGIVHRDLKPDNVFLASTPEGETPIRVKILDFGIAKLFGDGASEARKTRTGSLLGTPLYMSPEQCRGAGRIDHRSDIYSLGCIVFELLSGRPPFVREGHGELIIAHNSEPPPELATLVPLVPSALTTLVGRMLAKDVAHRPQSMSDVVREFEDLLGVPASRFATRFKVPIGFPIHGGSEDTPEPLETAPSRFTPWAPENPSTIASPAPSAPRTVVQAGHTKVLPGSPTTLSQAASAVPDRIPPKASRTGIKVGIGVGIGILALAGVALFAFLPAMKTASIATVVAPAAVSPGTPPKESQPPPGEPPPTPKVVTLDLQKAPAGLVVQLDGHPTTAPVTVPFGAVTHQLKVAAPGFKSEVLQVDGSRDQTIVLHMQAVAVAPARQPKAREHRSLSTAVRPSSAAATSRPAARKQSEGFTDL